MEASGGARAKTRKIKRQSRLSDFDIFHTPVYVINLKERPDRWSIFMEQDPSVKSLRIHRENATNGRKLNYLTDPRISPQSRLNIMRNDRRTHRELATMGAVGCSISHANIWKKIVASGAPYAVVMEDDARFDFPLLQKINEVAKTIPDSAKLWLFGMYKPNMIHEPFPNSKWSKVYQFTASHAYLITREMAKKLLEQVFPVEMHVDHYMSVMSVLYDMPMVAHSDVFLSFGGLMEKENKARAIESNTSQHRKDGCSACHVPDHLSRFYRRVGPKTRAGRIVRGVLREGPSKKVLTYKSVKAKLKSIQ
jgi:GR25 family glycosyltransferase involved in LPS biosynthesis